jgi:hypothetical protein
MSSESSSNSISIELSPDTLHKLKLACEGYDIPTTHEEIALTINSILIEWIERY